MEFIDEYRLLACTKLKSDAPPSLVVIDTRKNGGGAPIQTFFHFPLSFTIIEYLKLIFERGVHEPSSADALAPFYQDPAHRLIALAEPHTFRYLIFQVGALLKFLENGEGSNIGWDEWKGCVAIPSIDHDMRFARIWMSGCRLFCISLTGHNQGAQMEVYDFSMQGRAKYLSERVNNTLGGVRYLSSKGVRTRASCDEMLAASGSHEGTRLLHVSIRVLGSLRK